MKRRTWLKRRDKVRQRYWVGRRRNYAGGPLFGERLKEEIKLEGTPKEKRIIRRLFEKNPELIKKASGTIVEFQRFEEPPFKSESGVGRFERKTRTIQLGKTLEFLYSLEQPSGEPKLILYKKPTEEVLRHEITHAGQVIPPNIEQLSSSGLSKVGKSFEEEAVKSEKIIPERNIKPKEQEVMEPFKQLMT